METSKEKAEELVEDADEVRRKQEIIEMFVRLRKYRGRLPADFKFDREEAHERH